MQDAPGFTEKRRHSMGASLPDLSRISNESFDTLAITNVAQRPPGLEKQVETFKRQNLSLRVEIYYLKTRLREAGITSDCPDLRDYQLDPAALNGIPPVKNAEFGLTRQELEQLDITYKVRCAALQRELEQERCKSQAAINLRLKCQKLEQDKIALLSSLEELKKETSLLKNALAAMNESSEIDNGAISNGSNSSKDNKDAELLPTECRKCRRYERVLAAIRKKFAGKQEMRQDDNRANHSEHDESDLNAVDDTVRRWLQKSLCAQEDREAFKKKFLCIYSANSQLCKRMQESASVLKEICAKLADTGVDISDLTELHLLKDEIISKLNATGSLITALENSVSLAMPTNDDEVPRLQEYLVHMQTLLEQRDSHIETLKKTIENKTELIECLKRRLDEVEAANFIDVPQPTNHCCNDAAVQCKTTFDAETFQWPAFVLSMFPGLDALTEQFIFFLDVLTDVIGGDCSEDDKERLILNLCEHFRENLLPYFQALGTGETSEVTQNNGSEKTEKENADSNLVSVSEAIVEDSLDKKRLCFSETAGATSLNRSLSLLKRSHQQCCLAPDVMFSLCKEIRTAFQLLNCIQKSQSAAEVKEHFHQLKMTIQLCVDVSRKLFSHMQSAGKEEMTIIEEVCSANITGGALFSAQLLQSNSHLEVEEMSLSRLCHPTDVASSSSPFMLNASAAGRIQHLLASNQKCSEQMEAAVDKMNQNNREMEMAILKRKKVSKELQLLRDRERRLIEENCKAKDKIVLLEKELAFLKRQANHNEVETLEARSKGAFMVNRPDSSAEVRNTVRKLSTTVSDGSEGILCVDNSSKPARSQPEVGKATEIQKQNAKLLAEVEFYKQELAKTKDELNLTLKSLQEEQETKTAAAREITEDIKRTADLFRKLKHKPKH
ncbi:hypothetical protein TTRE_0000411101 [Trichuris trichiura]|uniref:Uncharacterized protein n=1 Tax=Trichuris trichiura TaxID=36087 RepID=A0A077Z5T8_TRITR|nr:hypothetical protein TTRE_0000411101 [Trichuris trichiura]